MKQSVKVEILIQLEFTEGILLEKSQKDLKRIFKESIEESFEEGYGDSLKGVNVRTSRQLK
ncbi:MAG: hypothetical protein ACRCW0_00260 [Clostridium sp.]